MKKLSKVKIQEKTEDKEYGAMVKVFIINPETKKPEPEHVLISFVDPTVTQAFSELV